MTCKACHLDHSPMLNCAVFKRQQDAINAAENIGRVVVNEMHPVVNASNVVVNRSKDRHKKTPERSEYMREYMRKRRAQIKAA